MSKELKTYREIIQAMLDGETVQHLTANEEWLNLNTTPGVYQGSLDTAPSYPYRIKPRTIKIGDIEVPAPVKDASEFEEGESYYLPRLHRVMLYEVYTWDGGVLDLRLLKHGMIHKALEGAVLHAKALVKISGGSYES